MSDKHTLGPWLTCHVEQGQILIVKSSPETISHIARIYPAALSPEHGDELTVQANARLIAAAPDLLAACELFTEIWRSWSDPANAAGAIFAAIAKAKGETK